jgi:nucleoside-diphosphate kinase
MPATQRTFVIIKPDAVQRGLIGEILGRFECKGLQVVAAKFVTPTADIAGQHYAEHNGKPFFPSLISFITSNPVLALALDGDEAITVVRAMVGLTDGRKSPPGTIRGDFGISKSNNLVHASDSPESAARELAIWFPEGVQAWTPAQNAWVYGD